MNKKYLVRLSDEERSICDLVVKKLKVSSQKVRRAQILLKTDAAGQGWTRKKQGTQLIVLRPFTFSSACPENGECGSVAIAPPTGKQTDRCHKVAPFSSIFESPFLRLHSAPDLPSQPKCAVERTASR